MEQEKMEQEKRQMKPVAMIFFLLFLALVLVLGWMMLAPKLERADTMPVYGSERWMADLPDERPLADLAIPGTHDSGTQYVQLAFFSKCQSLPVGKQLDAGFRYLDIRLGAEGEKLKLMHGFTNCKTGNSVWSSNLYLSEVLADCKAFLEENPTECILFAVKQEHGAESVTDFQKLLQKELLDSGIPVLESAQYPTLGEARGKLVLLRRYEDEAGLGAEAGIPVLWADQGGSAPDDASSPYADSENAGITVRVQDRFEYNADMKWTAFSETLKERLPEGNVTLDFLSTKGTAKYGHPYRFAKKLNKKLLKLDTAPYGDFSSGVWVILDFGSPKLAEKIYKLNFAE